MGNVTNKFFAICKLPLIVIEIVVLYIIINRNHRNYGPKKLWTNLSSWYMPKRLSNFERQLRLKVTHCFFRKIIVKDKCIVEATINAILLRTKEMRVIVCLGVKNKKYYQWQVFNSRIFGNHSQNLTEVDIRRQFETVNGRSYHCWASGTDGVLTLIPFDEKFWSVIYQYEF